MMKIKAKGNVCVLRERNVVVIVPIGIQKTYFVLAANADRAPYKSSEHKTFKEAYKRASSIARTDLDFWWILNEPLAERSAR